MVARKRITEAGRLIARRLEVMWLNDKGQQDDDGAIGVAYPERDSQ